MRILTIAFLAAGGAALCFGLAMVFQYEIVTKDQFGEVNVDELPAITVALGRAVLVTLTGIGLMLGGLVSARMERQA